MTPKWFIAYIGMSVELRERERENIPNMYALQMCQMKRFKTFRCESFLP